MCFLVFRHVKKVVAHPKRTICIYLIVLLIAAIGVFRLEDLKNNDVADLFTPSNSEGHEEKEALEKYFAPSDDSFQIIAVPISEGYTFNTEAWVELLTMEKKLMNLRVDEVGADDFCSTLMDGSCLHFSPFMYFDWNTETIGSSNKIQTICEHQKNYIPFYYIFGDTADVTVDSCSDPEKGLAKTKAFSIYFAMSFEKYNSTIPHDWIKEAEKIVEEFQEESKFWDTYFMSSYGLSNEVERGTLQTMTKLVVSIILVVIMLVFALHEDSWGISIGLAILALISVLLACGMGLGISLLIGLPWTTITPVIVFLALGLGVDNCVLFTILYYRGDRHLTHEKRMTEAGGEAALFNTLSTLTTVLAFLMGVNSSFKGIRTFCLSSAIVMTCVFFTAFTLYSAFLSLVMKKHEAKIAKLPKSKRRRHRKHRDDLITKFYKSTVSKIFLSVPARIVVLFLFIALLAFAGYEISTIQQGIVPEDAVPEDSFVTAYLGIAREYFKEKVAEMNVVFYDTAVERSTRRGIIDEVIQDMKNVTYVLPSYENPWEIFNDFLSQNNINPDRASGTRFYYYLLMCIRSNPRIAEHLSIDLDNFQIPASKVKFSLHPDAVQNIEQGEKALKGAREVLKKYRDQYGVYVSMKSYSSMYPYYEMVDIIMKETITNLITSAIAVMIVVFLLIPPGPSFLAVVCVLLADVCILGWIPFTGLNLNAISSTCLVMSVGIAVDFMSHISHAFVETDGSTMTGGERAAATVIRMGRSLTTSALTTFLSVLMLSTVNVPSNRMFFTMMAGVVLFGLLFGIILLPTILSFVNPHYVKPVPVGTPMTPLPPGEEAAMLEKSRSRGLKRHHRRRRKSPKPKEKPEEKETESDGTFQDCISDHGSIVENPEDLSLHSDDNDDLPKEIHLPGGEIEMVSMKSTKELSEELEDSQLSGENMKKTQLSGGNMRKLQLSGENVKKSPLSHEKPKESLSSHEKPKESQSSKNTKKSTEKPIVQSNVTAIKKFQRPRDIGKEESPKPEETVESPPATSSSGLLDSLWSIWGRK